MGNIGSNIGTGGSLSSFPNSEVKSYAINNGIVTPTPLGKTFANDPTVLTLGLDDVDGRTSSDDAELPASPSSWTTV